MPDTGAPLSLVLEPTGTVGWGDAVNGNFTAINSSIAGLLAGGSTGPQGAPGAAGSPGIVWAGPWGSLTPYTARNAVGYNGSSYLALADNTGVQPDNHPATWALLALAGAQGLQGIQGLQGVPGPAGGTTITFPIAVEQGGTSADNADEARQNLNAASNGQNRDITGLFNIACGGTPTPDTTGITIRSNGGEGTAISVGDGTNFGGITSSGGIFAKYMNCQGTVVCGGLVSSGLLQTNAIGDATPGNGISVADTMRLLAALLIQGAAPVVASGQVGLSGNTASTASDGGGQAVPGHVLTWWVGNFGGVAGKVPVFAV